ncbi:hypothetical protein N0V93_008948 [Gnomoniopsis smithogilvyi]|uniref:Neutral protease 2 n=1 Tax=Gnomoniopsis smithogilvyi TaxID=1191159 RepID=A0A9W8YK68_9PEZI|nr:hypothetical protein N0V93_008948 [Gnomoniopsis smithogilvyi]
MLMLAALGAFAALASAAPYMNNRRSTGIELQLSQESPTDIKASVSNTGAEAVRLFIDGTILDTSGPVQRLDVFQDEQPVEFLGVIVDYLISDLTENSFITLQPGESAEKIVNLPSLYNLNGGEYTVSLTNTFEFAAVDSTQLAGVYEFQSNTLSFNIDAETIAAVPKALDKRVEVVSCAGTQRTALTNAIAATNRLATNAASAAASGSATKFQEYFRTTSASTRSNVASRFRTFASEAASTTSGQITYSCTDFAGICAQGNIIAYAQPSTGQMANCPLFYRLPAVSGGCDEQSQASTVLHEFTHVLADTNDWAYGYSASTALTAARAYTNADNYALYADAIANGC